MPITVTAPRGALTPSGEREILPRLTAALIEVSGVTGNASSPRSWAAPCTCSTRDVYAGGANRPVVMVELKLPDIGLPTVEARAQFIVAATDIVAELAVPGHDRDDIWVNILNALDGAWGIGGQAYTGDDLIAATAQAAQDAAPAGSGQIAVGH